VLEYTNVKYKSSVDGMEIRVAVPTAQKRGPRGHAAMVWVHGGVHGSWWSYRLFPFVKEAIQRGYVIIAPEYRASTGFRPRITTRSTTAGRNWTMSLRQSST
jgi:dipeptidyl aminopeptidase/acylaminoacyl peptidase